MQRDLPPDYEAFKAQVVSDQAREEQGVYEVLWHANTWYPSEPMSRRMAVAESVVEDLLRAGAVSLARGKWVGSEHEHEAVSDSASVLREWATWVPEPDEPVTWMANAQ